MALNVCILTGNSSSGSNSQEQIIKSGQNSKNHGKSRAHNCCYNLWIGKIIIFSLLRDKRGDRGTIYSTASKVCVLVAFFTCHLIKPVSTLIFKSQCLINH